MDQLRPLPPDQNDDSCFSTAGCFICDVNPAGLYDTHYGAGHAESETTALYGYRSAYGFGKQGRRTH